MWVHTVPCLTQAWTFFLHSTGLLWWGESWAHRSIYVPTLTYGHMLRVMAERTRSGVRVTEMSFLHSVAGLSLKWMRSSDLHKLPLCIQRNQFRWFEYLVRMPPCWNCSPLQPGPGGRWMEGCLTVLASFRETSSRIIRKALCVFFFHCKILSKVKPNRNGFQQFIPRLCLLKQ